MAAVLPSKAELRKQAREFSAIHRRLRGEGVPFVTALVMAGDIQTAARADEMLAAGESPRELVWRVGSYARFEWAVKNLPRRTLFSILPELWVASDPDDTRPEYLALWREAYRRNGGRTVTDGPALPSGLLTIYRGQVGERIGISWTLDKGVAEKFARTGGGRGSVVGGKVLTRRVHSSQVFAYLTQRNESEIIYDCLD